MTRLAFFAVAVISGSGLLNAEGNGVNAAEIDLESQSMTMEYDQENPIVQELI